jgi:uncharacterized protein YjiS (DUF1127 family)
MMVEQPPDFLVRLRQAWRRALSNRRGVNELAACPPGELRRIASDVGLTDGDLRQLSYSPVGSSELLLQRLQLLRIDPEFARHAAPATFRDLARVCASCKASRRCRRDLARGDVQAGMDGYCLNGPTIDALIARDGRTV